MITQNDLKSKISSEDICRRCLVTVKGEFIDKFGRIVYFHPTNKDFIGVEFDESNKMFHTLDGNCKDKHGYWCYEDQIELLPQYSVDDLEINDFSAKDLYLLGFPKEAFIEFMEKRSCYGLYDFNKPINKEHGVVFEKYPCLKKYTDWLFYKGLVSVKK